jgi:Flp pilus assembly protein TadG
MLFRGAATARPVRVGAHMVEFAVVIPVFFLFIFGLIEIGRGMMVESLVTNAARVGCRTGILPGKTNSDVSATVDSLLAGQGVSGYTTTVMVNGSTATNVSAAQTQDTVTVIITVPAANTSWLPSVLFVKGNITGQFTMPHE